MNRNSVKSISHSVLNNYNTFRYTFISRLHRLFDRSTTFEGKNRIYENVKLSNCIIGLGTYVGPNSKLINTEVGRYCSIGPNVNTIIGKHPSKDHVSTCPAFYSLQKQNGFTYTDKQVFDEIGFIDSKSKISVIIGNDVWVGAHAIILEGVRVGDGSIIGTGAVVNKDVEPYTIVGGIPAKLIRKRFTDEEIDFLLKTKWWDQSEEWLKSNVSNFQNVDLFIKNFNCHK